MRSREHELDPSCLMDCPGEGCDGILMRINLPSEAGRYQCLICGLITWDTPEVMTSNMDIGFTLTVPLDNWSPTG